MKLNPALQTMTLDDLRQRYRESYIWYDKQPLYCDNFDSGPAAEPMMFFQDAKGKKAVMEFNWELLDVQRPRARWYDVKDKSGIQIPQFLEYYVSRQWRRGISRQNTYVYSPYTQSWSWFALLDAAYTQTIDCDFRKAITFKELHASENFHILSPWIMATGGKAHHPGTIWYKNKVVGTIDAKHVLVSRPSFEPELREVIQEADFKENLNPKDLAQGLKAIRMSSAALWAQAVPTGRPQQRQAPRPLDPMDVDLEAPEPPQAQVLGDERLDQEGVAINETADAWVVGEEGMAIAVPKQRITELENEFQEQHGRGWTGREWRTAVRLEAERERQRQILVAAIQNGPFNAAPNARRRPWWDENPPRGGDNPF